MNKPIALPFGSMPRLGLNAQVTLGPTVVGAFGVLPGSTVTSSGRTVVVGNLGPPAGLPESLGTEKMKQRDPQEAFGCTLGALSAGQESKQEILARRIIEKAVTIGQHQGLNQFQTHILVEGSI